MTETTKMTLIDALNRALTHEMAEDERVMLLGQDVGQSGGVFRVTEGLQEDFGAERVVDTPLSESAIVGAAVGLSSFGHRPIAEIQFSGFLPIAMNQLMIGSRLRWRSRGEFTAPMVVRSTYGGGVRAPEHHSESYESMFATVPGLKVVVPSNPGDAYGLLLGAIRDPDPVLFLEPKYLYRSFTEQVADDGESQPLESATVLQEGTDVTAVTWGTMVETTKEAIADLEDDVSVELIDLRTIYPYDKTTVVDSVKKTGRAVVVHEAAQTAGFGAEISARISSDAPIFLEAPLRRETGFDTPPPMPALEDYYRPNPARIKQTIADTVNYE
jgi:pyruvate dehydrogenase E1 component beta subunit